jgi:hypothetical protein
MNNMSPSYYRLFIAGYIITAIIVLAAVLITGNSALLLLLMLAMITGVVAYVSNNRQKN